MMRLRATVSAARPAREQTERSERMRRFLPPARLGGLVPILGVSMSLVAAADPGAAGSSSEARTGSPATVAELLHRELANGEAVIWHLGHAGWAIKTRTRLLVFDYAPMLDPPAEPSLANGHIDPGELSDQRTVVFVSHSHGDHYDRGILEWTSRIADIHYVFGWAASADPGHVCLTDEHAVRDLDGLEIAAIHHAFDGIPEAAFLVRLDGLTIYHSGDHGSTGDELNPVFKANIDYLAARTDGIDLALLSIFGRRGGGAVNRGDLYTIERLRPRVTFAMHRGLSPQSYAQWARAAVEAGVESTVSYAESPGNAFVYRDGRITELKPGGRTPASAD